MIQFSGTINPNIDEIRVDPSPGKINRKQKFGLTGIYANVDLPDGLANNPVGLSAVASFEIFSATGDPNRMIFSLDKQYRITIEEVTP